MKKKIKINERERETLKILSEISESSGGMCCSFDYISGYSTDSTFDIKVVRRACRSLRKKGLAEFYRGLMNEDGQVAGSGYCISTEGEDYINPCVDCGAGSTARLYCDKYADSKHILVCEECYEKRTK